MESTSGWWHRNAWTLAVLLAAFGAAIAVRTIWTYPIVSHWGALYTYAGGSDSYYHSRVMQYIILTHTNLVRDPLLKFPFGSINPREPLFDWMNAVLGIVFAPFFGGNAVNAAAWFLDFQGPLWAGLSVFPVYLIGKEVGSRRTGLIAAMIFPFIPASIDSSIFGYANYLSFYTFIILVVVYSWIRTVKATGTHRYVGSYRHPRQILQGIRNFVLYERTSVKWSVFTGVGLGTLALAWQGYTYAVVIIAFSVLILLIAERIRRVDSFGLYVSAWIVGIVAFPMAAPYYIVQAQFNVWFDLPLLLYFGTLLLLLPFLLMRDTPWVVSIPSLVGLVVLAAVGLAIVSPGYFTTIVTGQGYFVKNLIYSTVAEAQAPSIDELVISYGVITFFVAFVGIALFAYQLGRGHFPRAIVVFLVFAVLSVYLPISAAKFFLLGSPAFALLPAEALRRALDVAGFPELRRTVASLSDTRSKFGAFRRAFKVRHVLIMALVVGLILPNIWISIDAGIPGNDKSQLSAQVGASLPAWLQPTSGPPSSVYFGAAGTSLDTPDQYDSAGYNWLATQDTALPAPNRPAFVSWWDYGFQAIDQGQHPSVADNFQNGIDPAGQFLLSQNESLAIGVLATTLLQAEQTKSLYLPPALNAILAGDGINVAQLHTLLVNKSADLPLVENHPEKYLPVNPSTLTADNAMYLAVSYFLADSLPLSGVSHLYDQIQSYTGWTIRYAMSDSRLIPFSGQDTGIFYAPADLTGRVIDAAGLPGSFFNVTVLGSDGNSYPLGQVPASVQPVNYTINYFTPFYSSFIYHTYFGYNGTEIGQGGGIPGLSSNLASSQVEPGWMLQHFEVVYRTAYYCPTKSNDQNDSHCLAENLPTAQANAKSTNGSVANLSAIRYFQGGESMLEYYPGQTLLGDVTLPDGTPISGVRATVLDQWGIPHQTTFTARDGSFSLVLPPGNDTVNITTGTFQGLSQQGNILLRSIRIYVPEATGLNLQAPSLVRAVTIGQSTVSGVVYWNLANNSTFLPARDPVIPGAQVLLWGPDGLATLTTTTDLGGTFNLPNVAPGVYNYSVLYDGHNYTQTSVFVHANSENNASAGLSSGIIRGAVTQNGAPANRSTVAISNASGTFATNGTNASGDFEFRGLGPGNYTVTAFGSTGVRSSGVQVQVLAPGTSATVHLLLTPTAQLQYVVEAAGGGIAGIPVRFVPLPSYSNSSVAPLASLESQTQNGTTLVSGPNGLVVATLPVGTYSVYALGYVGSSLEAALTSAAVIPGYLPGPVALPLQPAATLSGHVAYVGSQSNGTKTAVLVYGAGEAETTVWATVGNAYSVILPEGIYSVLALEGQTTVHSPLYAALGTTTVQYPTSLALSPSPAIESRFTVGSVLPGGSFFSAPAATVSISAGLTGPSIAEVADANGSVAYFLPTTLPLSAGSYCVNAGSAGFTSAASCDYTPAGLGALQHFSLALNLVPVTLRVLGLPLGTPVTINLSATSPSAETRNLTGGPTFTFSTTPGSYSLSARAVIGNGTVVYLPSSILTTTIPLGATSTRLTLLLVPAVNASGSLVLPPGGTVANVTVSLASPVLNVTVNGTAYSSTGIRVAPGTYSAHATVSVGGTTYNNLTTVSVSPSGVISPSLVIRAAAVSLAGSLRTAIGTIVPANTTVTLTAPGGARLVATATDGTFSATLPSQTVFQAAANVTLLVSGTNGSLYETYTSMAGASCTTGTTSGSCIVSLSGVPNLVWLNGTLSTPGQPGLLAGSVRIVGPFPSTNVTIVSTSNGSFSTLVLPGAYSLYATAGGGAGPLAALSRTVAGPGLAPISLVLAPTWSVALRVTGPNGTVGGLGPATVVLQDATGTQSVFTGVSMGSTISIALPIGKYSLRASSNGTPYGVTTTALSTSTFTVSDGNLAVNVSLAYQWAQTVSASLVGPTSATVAATGGTATFQFVVQNTGNLPVTVHAVGSPDFWTFAFSQGNLTLAPAPSGSPVTEEVTITIPSGTLVAHPNVVLELVTSTGAVEGTVLPAPAVQVVASYGLRMGPAVGGGAKVFSNSTLTPFYVANTGNTFEAVNLQIVNALRLNALGWNSEILIHGIAPLKSPPVLPAGANTTYFVNLTAIGPIFLAPSPVEISGSVLNASGSVSASATVTAPRATLSASTAGGRSAVIVTGPGIGPAPSSWPTWLIPLLVFVPAIALAIGLVSWRWWRTRRWTRR